MVDKEDIDQAKVERSIYRVHLVGIVWLLFLCVIVGRLFYIQIIDTSTYKTLAQNQYTKQVPTGFDRGTVLLQHYKSDPVPLAQITTTYTLAIDPTRVSVPEEAYEEISEVMPLSRDVFMTKAKKVDDPYEEVVGNIDEETMLRLAALKIKGVSFVKNNKRSYPQQELMAKVIGFVGNNGRTIQGQYGLEKYYNDILVRGESGIATNFFAELFADIEHDTVSNLDHNEGDVMLTVDAELARVLRSVLVETRQTWNSETIGGIIMDPQTGAILAMDELPSFDPNNFGDVKNPQVFTNHLVSGVYEMGSIIKPITVAAAVDAGVATASTTYIDTGFRDLDGYKVRNFDSKPRGVTDVQTILDKSLNMGIVFLVEKLGVGSFQKYLKAFGLGSESGVDLPGEVGGLTHNLESSVFVDNATAGFGQGIAITPIQTIRALAAVGNGGFLVTPHIVDSVTYNNGTTKKVALDTKESVIKQSTSEEVSRMLVHVVDTALKNGTYKMDHYSIAAKTGTAQMPKPGGGYYDDRYLHSFFGYFPAYEPKYIIFLFQTHPHGAEYASATLTDSFFKLVKFIISYYEVPPDR